jgi:hypothetical protein
VPTAFVPWEGRHVVLVTLASERADPAFATHYVKHLDSGWETYAELTSRTPSTFKNHRGKPTVLAVPSARYTCGAGCGYVGATGIELTMVYNRDLQMWGRDPRAFPHYAFYELGRNFSLFQDQADAFTCGYAVFVSAPWFA